jgi:hypothetical protein
MLRRRAPGVEESMVAFGRAVAADTMSAVLLSIAFLLGARAFRTRGRVRRRITSGGASFDREVAARLVEGHHRRSLP